MLCFFFIDQLDFSGIINFPYKYEAFKIRLIKTHLCILFMCQANWKLEGNTFYCRDFSKNLLARLP